MSPGPGSGVYDHIGDTADVGGGGVGLVCPCVFLQEVARGGKLVSLNLGSEGRCVYLQEGYLGWDRGSLYYIGFIETNFV